MSIDLILMTLLLVALGSHFVSEYSSYHQYSLNIRSGLFLRGNVFLIRALEKNVLGNRSVDSSFLFN